MERIRRRALGNISVALENDNYGLLVKIVEELRYDEVAGFTNSMLEWADERGTSVAMMKALVESEIRGCQDASTLFRANSGPSKALATAVNRYGKIWVAESIGETIRRICDNTNTALVIDPFLTRDKNTLRSSRDALSFLTETLLELIFSSLEKIPKTLRDLCRVVSKATRASFPERYSQSNSSGDFIIAGMVFLRLICPALMAPERFDITNAPPSPDARRTLIHASKLIQSLANGVVLAKTEPHMAYFTPLLDRYRTKMDSFLLALASFDGTPVVVPVEPHDASPPTTLSSPSKHAAMSRPGLGQLAALGSRGMNYRANLARVGITEETTTSPRPAAALTASASSTTIPTMDETSPAPDLPPRPRSQTTASSSPSTRPMLAASTASVSMKPRPDRIPSIDDLSVHSSPRRHEEPSVVATPTTTTRTRKNWSAGEADAAAPFDGTSSLTRSGGGRAVRRRNSAEQSSSKSIRGKNSTSSSRQARSLKPISDMTDVLIKYEPMVAALRAYPDLAPQVVTVLTSISNLREADEPFSSPFSFTDSGSVKISAPVMRGSRKASGRSSQSDDDDSSSSPVPSPGGADATLWKWRQERLDSLTNGYRARIDDLQKVQRISIQTLDDSDDEDLDLDALRTDVAEKERLVQKLARDRNQLAKLMKFQGALR